jgi:hypothetical protein
MADLLAIISEDRSREVSLAELLADYDSLRGGATTRERRGCGWAEVAVLDHPEPASAGIEPLPGGAGWTAWAGSLSAPGELAAADPAELEGQFALARLSGEGAAATLAVATDPLGLKPLYTARSGGLAYFSTSALALARHLRLAPSRLGVETFLRTGMQFGRETPWEGLERLQPAERVAFAPAGRSTEVYWQPTVDPAVRALGFEDAAAACAERAGAAFAARYGGAEPWCDLTGGFDTRLLALLARRGGVAFRANTVGDAETEDVRIAQELAAAGGWPWQRLDLPGDWAERAPERLGEALAWGDCNLEVLGLSEVLETHRQKAATGTGLLNGAGGEHFRDYPWGQELWAANRSTEVNLDRLLSWRLLGPLDLSPFRTDPTAAVAAGRRLALEERLAPFAGTPNTFQCDLLYALKSTGHGGAYQAAAGAWVHMEIPFYLRSVFGSAISASPRHRNLHRLMRQMMALLDPRLAAIGTETGGPAEPLRAANLPRFAPYAWRRGKRFAYRLRGRVLGESGAPAEANPRQLSRAVAVGRLRDEGRLDPARMRSASLYDPERLEALLASAVTAPATVDWATVGRLVTVELALESVDAGLE